MNKLIIYLLSVMLFCMGCNGNASEYSASENLSQNNTQPASANTQKGLKSTINTLKDHLEKATELKVSSVSATPFSGLYEVILDQGEIIYSNADGSYFVAGDLYQVRSNVKGLVNITESKRAEQRVASLESISKKDAIVFDAQAKTRSHIYVFTDVDCYYCQKLHQEVPELNKRGVEVRYLAFPRAGLNSASYRKMQSAWCAKDKKKAMNKLKARKTIEQNLCESRAVAEQFLLGQKIGVRGTPAIFLTSGELISGYLPTDKLMARIGLQ